ncbi:MAG: 50S ribosomal protein L9 [Gammaproteobacteria bacterium]|nr:50S ribosomal protein L9 [Gammaproteobacteria bacterium]
MNIILLERVSNLGDLGEEVSVRRGYARNYLIPTGQAVLATDANRMQFESRRAELERVANAKLTDASERASKLVDRSVTIVARASEEGNLYGSVGTVEIARALTESILPVAKSEVRMPEGTIRAVGEYEVDVQFHADVTETIRVEVVAE